MSSSEHRWPVLSHSAYLTSPAAPFATLPVSCLRRRLGIRKTIWSAGSNWGGDDYLTKPFSFREFLASFIRLWLRQLFSTKSRTLTQCRAETRPISGLHGAQRPSDKSQGLYRN